MAREVVGVARECHAHLLLQLEWVELAPGLGDVTSLITCIDQSSGHVSVYPYTPLYCVDNNSLSRTNFPLYLQKRVLIGLEIFLPFS